MILHGGNMKITDEDMVSIQDIEMGHLWIVQIVGCRLVFPLQIRMENPLMILGNNPLMVICKGRFPFLPSYIE